MGNIQSNIYIVHVVLIQTEDIAPA